MCFKLDISWRLLLSDLRLRGSLLPSERREPERIMKPSNTFGVYWMVDVREHAPSDVRNEAVQLLTEFSDVFATLI